MDKIRYHVPDSDDEWDALECTSIEIVKLQEPECFQFDIKVETSSTHSDVYIPISAITVLNEIRYRSRSKDISLEPKYHIKIFDYIDSVHDGEIVDAPKLKHRYPTPADFNVASAVVERLFNSDDLLATESEDIVVYYYLSVLKAVNHPVLNEAHFNSLLNESTYSTTWIPKWGLPKQHLDYYVMYNEIIYFFSLLALPNCESDNESKMTRMIRKRHNEQQTKFHKSINIRKFKPICRGKGWKKLNRFLKANPSYCHELTTAILKSSTNTMSPLNSIEYVTINQIKELWKWNGLCDFLDCYLFTMSDDTEAHHIQVVADQGQLVKSLYEKLSAVVKDPILIPYAKLLIKEESFFNEFEVCNFPDLFYATKSNMIKNKMGNPAWEEFVTTAVITVPRKEIDEKLQIPVSKQEHFAESLLTGDDNLVENLDKPLVSKNDEGLESQYCYYVYPDEDDNNSNDLRNDSDNSEYEFLNRTPSDDDSDFVCIP